MNWFIILIIFFLSVTIASFAFGSSSYRSQPGKGTILEMLKSNRKWSQLLLPEYDQEGAIFQYKHQSVTALVKKANSQFEKRQSKLASRTLSEAILIYQEVRDEVRSAVVELNRVQLLPVTNASSNIR
jgi:hypothetical protein